MRIGKFHMIIGNNRHQNVSESASSSYILLFYLSNSGQFLSYLGGMLSHYYFFQTFDLNSLDFCINFIKVFIRLYSKVQNLNLCNSQIVCVVDIVSCKERSGGGATCNSLFREWLKIEHFQKKIHKVKSIRDFRKRLAWANKIDEIYNFAEDHFSCKQAEDPQNQRLPQLFWFLRACFPPLLSSSLALCFIQLFSSILLMPCMHILFNNKEMDGKYSII